MAVLSPSNGGKTERRVYARDCFVCLCMMIVSEG